MNLTEWLKSSTLVIIATLLLFSAKAQKKVIAVTQSSLTGIALPAGSKQDTRMLMKASGNALLEMETKKTNTTISKIEILYLPANAVGADAASIVKLLSAIGWTITPVQTDEKYAWMQKDNRHILIYFAPGTKENNLYFGEVNSAPALSDNGNNFTGNQNGNNNPPQNTVVTDVSAPVQNTEPINPNPANDATTAAPSGFAFSTTNFDDGWTSTVLEDWVEVTKGNIKVLLHYPKEGTIFPADPEPLTNAAWNILVAPRYSNLKNYKTSYINDYTRPYLGMGYATEIATGKEVFILLFRQGQTGWLEFVAPDKNSFIQQYKFDPETIRWDSDGNLMTPLSQMTSYNKFAVAASDFKGKWTSDFTGIQQLYFVYTGNYAGMQINQSNEEFVFSGDNYNWKSLVVNGMAGNAKSNQVKSAGKFSVPNNWQVHFTMIESKAKTCHAFWSCIKGARILNLLDADYPGSGIYTKYGLSK